jgi:hypothetical protein
VALLQDRDCGPARRSGRDVWRAAASRVSLESAVRLSMDGVFACTVVLRVDKNKHSKFPVTRICRCCWTATESCASPLYTLRCNKQCLTEPSSHQRCREPRRGPNARGQCCHMEPRTCNASNTRAQSECHTQDWGATFMSRALVWRFQSTELAIDSVPLRGRRA